MRTRDQLKKEAIFEATVKLVNEIGFVASSVAKIAREAAVSPATIYIYYKNKEDLLISTYMEIKQKIGIALLDEYDESIPIRDSLKQIWKSGFRFITSHSEYFHFVEQFANSPYVGRIDKTKLEQLHQPIQSLIERGMREKIIKDVPFELVGVFFYYPIMLLSNKRLHSDLEVTDEIFEAAFSMAWDAIRL